MNSSSNQCGTVELDTDICQENPFRILADAIPQLVFTAKPDGSVDFLNQRCFEYTGLPKESLFGWSWIPVVHPDDQLLTVERYKYCLDTGTTYEIEVRILRNDGEYRWHLVRAYPYKNEEGQITKWVGTATDIHDQKHAQETLAEEEAHFRAIADCIPHILWTSDAQGKMDFFNARWFEYTGLTREQSEKDAWRLLMHPADAKRFAKEWKKALETGDTCEVEFRLKRTLGRAMTSNNPYRWHLHRAVALRKADGTITKWFATWTEIDDQIRKSSEQQTANTKQKRRKRD